jgi:putative flippase GtrA
VRGQLSRFLHVGAVGFGIDAGLLWLMVYVLALPPIMGRGISFLVTILLTFVLNSRYTFNVAPQKSRMPRYGVIQGLGALLNFGSYSWLVAYWRVEPLLALMVGSAIGSTHNFLMMRRFVFKKSPFED